MAGLIATPILAALLGRLVQPLFRHLLGLGGRLAADNLVRAPGRTGIVIAALAATGGLLVQTAGFLKSTREAIYDWVEEKIAADLFVTCGSSLTSGGAGLSMDESLQKKLAAFPGVETVLPVRFCRLDFDPLGRPRDPHDKKQHHLPRRDGHRRVHQGGQGSARWRRAWRGSRTSREPGKVVVSDNFAYLYNVKVGDKLKLPADGKTVEVEVVGKVVDYSWNRGTIIMDRAWFREVYGDHQIDVFDLFLKPGADPHAVRDDLMKTHGQKEALFIVDRADVHSEVKAMLQKVYSLAYAQQIVVGLVALLGVVSALFISVLQRRRELGLSARRRRDAVADPLVRPRRGDPHGRHRRGRRLRHRAVARVVRPRRAAAGRVGLRVRLPRAVAGGGAGEPRVDRAGDARGPVARVPGDAAAHPRGDRVRVTGTAILPDEIRGESRWGDG